MFRPGELRWLFSGSLLLVLLYLLISRWSAAPEPREAGAPTAATAGQAVPSAPRQAASPARAPAGPADDEDRPTDLDPDERESAKEEFQAVSDGTLTLGREEMEAYYRLVTWVESQSFAELQRRAAKGLWYTDLHDHPDRHRGQIVALDLDVVRAQELGADNRLKVPLWEVFGATDESRPWLYDLVVVDFPKGMPTGPSIRARARFVGYFLKAQGYLPHDARPGQPPEKAPLLIGRLRWEPLIVPQTDQSLEWALGAVLLAVVAGLLVGRLAWRARTGKQKRLGTATETIGTARPERQTNPVDAWLQGVEQGRPEDPADEQES
jgi:hypothetical protein